MTCGSSQLKSTGIPTHGIKAGNSFDFPDPDLGKAGEMFVEEILTGREKSFHLDRCPHGIILSTRGRLWLHCTPPVDGRVGRGIHPLFPVSISVDSRLTLGAYALYALLITPLAAR